MTTPRVALCGIILESNAFSPVATAADFAARTAVGDELLAQARADTSPLAPEMRAFVRTMDATGDWVPVPLLVSACHPWGPIDESWFETCVARMLTMLEAAGRVDGIYIANHGAMVATHDPDPDGAMLARLRAAAGDSVCIALTLDLHANISARMVDACDVVIGYKTNPHVDMLECGARAAHAMRATFASHIDPQVRFERLPLTPPSVTLLTAAGPYGELMDRAQRRRRESGGAILDASVFGGFVFSDTPENGLSAVVTASRDSGAATALAHELCGHAWAMRERFQRHLTSLDDAVAMAVTAGEDADAPAHIFSDAGDNPGGGGTGRTTELLAALVNAGAKGVLFGAMFDPALAARARDAGAGSTFDAVFNHGESHAHAPRFVAKVRVLAVNEGIIVGRRGLYAGRELGVAPSCALEVGDAGLIVVALSARYQCADPIIFEHLGLDVAAARTVCVKSRGHFRAGFDEFFAPEQVIEVDTSGLTSPVLSRFEWRGLPRPVYPLDADARWPG